MKPSKLTPSLPNHRPFHLMHRAAFLACLLGLETTVPLPAQNSAPPTTAAVSPASPPSSLADLMQHRNSWPRQVTLKVPVRMSIVSHGREVGSIVSSEGTVVDLVSVTEAGLEVRVVSARAVVDPGQTDLWVRVAAASQKTNAAPVASVPLPPLVVVTPAAPAPPPAAAAVDSGPPLQLDDEIGPRDNFTKAAFRFWSPAYTQPIRGVIVLVPGLSGDGRGMLLDPAWQTLARKYRLALVACFLQGGSYYNAPRGTGDALLEALRDFAHQAGRPELSQAPLLLYGESAGGQFDYDFVLWKPERVIAFIVNKGGYYNRDEAEADTRAVPGLFFLGLQDSDLRIQAITGIWTEGRKKGALWALAPQPNSGHEFSRTAPVAQVFFASVLKNRLPDDPAVSGDAPPLQAMQESPCWLGDLTTHQVHDASTDPAPDRTAAWFPDRDSAAAWKAFVSP